MLDTHILIYLMKNKPPGVAERVNALGSEAELCMSFFMFAELLMGAERSMQKTDVLRRQPRAAAGELDAGHRLLIGVFTVRSTDVYRKGDDGLWVLQPSELAPAGP